MRWVHYTGIIEGAVFTRGRFPTGIAPSREPSLELLLALRRSLPCPPLWQILTRILAEGRIAENAPLSKAQRWSRDPYLVATRGLPPARTQAILGWAAAIVDAHFTPLAVGGYSGSSVLGVLRTLERVAKQEMRCCESLLKVREGGLRRRWVRGGRGGEGACGLAGNAPPFVTASLVVS